jgi:hypothetical protein
VNKKIYWAEPFLPLMAANLHPMLAKNGAGYGIANRSADQRPFSRAAHLYRPRRDLRLGVIRDDHVPIGTKPDDVAHVERRKFFVGHNFSSCPGYL